MIDAVVEGPRVASVFVRRCPADPTDDERIALPMFQRAEWKRLEVERAANEASPALIVVEPPKLRLQLRALMVALEDVSLERSPATIVPLLLGEKPRHAVDPDDPAAQAAETVGCSEEIGVAERHDGAARQSGHVPQSIRRDFDRRAADPIESRSPCLGGLPGWHEGHLQAKPPPQLHRVPTLGVCSAHVARITGDEDSWKIVPGDHRHPETSSFRPCDFGQRQTSCRWHPRISRGALNRVSILLSARETSTRVFGPPRGVWMREGIGLAENNGQSVAKGDRHRRRGPYFEEDDHRGDEAGSRSRLSTGVAAT